eukprot:TRINITY_DN42_c2_g1_i2.p1 TRINITY_DN42_c2_g1~~TRINITY_DN42_c2_g1_i2.p1  ORF type:complete len:149 (+),score=34.63 TRINITY_DN42_c2_g1_i2:67-447(+)
MSWQSYVDNNLVGTGFISQGAIFGLNGAQWCTSAGFQISGPEAQALIAGFGDAGPLRANGLWLQGQKYLVLRADERSIYGKKGPGGVVLVKTGQAVLVGIYGENTQPGQASSTVERLADYLIETGY